MVRQENSSIRSSLISVRIYTGKEISVVLRWFLGKYKDESTVSHGGGDTGFSTNLVLMPEKSMAVIVLCNLNSAPIFEVTNAALDILLGYDPEIYKDYR